MKDILKILFMVFIVIVVYLYKDNIANFVTDEIIYKGSNKVLTYNEYFLDNNYLYVQNIDINEVNNYQELLNIFYTTVNSGDNSYSFYCSYDKCIDDVNKLIDDQEFITSINNFVHPYNSFSYINVSIDSKNKITIKSKKVYTEQQIEYVNNYVNDFINKNVKEEMSNYDKIKIFHDHIINNTYYEDSNKELYNAYYLLTKGKGICGGYSDILSIYMNILGIQNYKISSESHVWNLVNLDNTWYHLDATWDDPVTNDGKQYLIHNFFLISTKELHELDNVEHNFVKTIYQEAK